MKLLNHLNLAQNELQNAVIQRLSSDPGSPVEGQIYYNTVSDVIKYYDGVGWVDLAGGAGGVKITIDDSAPTVNNDETEDYSIGSLWIDNTNGDDHPAFYIATNVAEASAEWVMVNATTIHTTNPATTDTDYPNGHLWVNTTAQRVFIKAGVDTGDAIWKEVAAAPSLGTDDITNDSGVAGATASDALDQLDSDIDAVETDVDDLDTRVTTAESDIDSLESDKADITYVDGLVQGAAWKAPVRVATTAAITLATGLENGDTIDGVTLSTGDRVLVKNQSSQTENGIYIVPASGAPSRAPDANTAAELHSAVVAVLEGTANANTSWIQITDNITIGSSNIVFQVFHTAEVPAASTTVAGKVELATEAETIARSDGTRAVTPAGLATFPRKYAEDIGDNSSTDIVVTHNLGSKDVVVSVYQNDDDAEVLCDVEHTSTNTITLSFTEAPDTDALRVVVVG